jgi:RNA ligase (TIGR02306 family)
MERKLASIQVIRDIRPIEGADAIELAIINNWQVVVAKNVGHQIGDHVVYCEIDSFLPIQEEFEFLRKSSYKKMADREGFRLKTIKLRGQVSQGLILPMSVFGDFGWTAYEGLDVTERLGIIKYEL